MTCRTLFPRAGDRVVVLAVAARTASHDSLPAGRRGGGSAFLSRQFPRRIIG
jgi:hypothetical protein